MPLSDHLTVQYGRRAWRESLNIVVVGGNGGIGQAIVQTIVDRYPHASVLATWRRTPPPAIQSNASAEWIQLDASDEDSVEKFARQLKSLDWLINAAGMLHTPDFGPEKTIRHFDADFFTLNMTANVLPTLLLAKHFGRCFSDTEKGVFATVSAKVGSIQDNRLGGWTSYRCSKAALNMALKNISIEWGRINSKVCVAALHPGTTDTDLSKPFQGAVARDKLFSPQRTAGYLIDVVETLTPENSGQFLAYDGAVLPW